MKVCEAILLILNWNIGNRIKRRLQNNIALNRQEIASKAFIVKQQKALSYRLKSEEKSFPELPQMPIRNVLHYPGLHVKYSHETNLFYLF